ncbi:DUF2637 domain-containing protein [Leifsonia xyli]|uniref:DUF2637 domain-containing protein n=1 Tax=Leifsonia xyli TaxID=1575 RepID=UPI003D673729
MKENPLRDFPLKEPVLGRLLSGTRLDPRRSTAFALLTIVSALVVGVMGMLASWNGLIAVAAWAQLAMPMNIAVPVVIDASIVVFSLAATLQRARGHSTLLAWTCVGLFTTISVVANAVHVLLPSPDGPTPQVVIGACVAGLMPISILLVTHTETNLLVRRPTKSAEELRALDEAELDARQEIKDRRAALRAEQMQAQHQVEEAERREGEWWEAWEDVRALPEIGVPGSPDRKRLETMVIEAIERHEGNVQRASNELDYSYPSMRGIWKKHLASSETENR